MLRWPALLLCTLVLTFSTPLHAQQDAVTTSSSEAPAAAAALPESVTVSSTENIQPAEANQASTSSNQQQSAQPAPPTTFIGRWQARATKTQNEQPHWITPLVTVTPRLEQEFRTDFVHQYNPSGFAVWNYGNSKGLELIPEKHTELIFNLPPFFNRTNGESDGFGDFSFLAKERLYSRNEENGNAIVTVFLAATIPTGKNDNGSCCAVITPTLAVGKGFGQLALTSTAGGSLPVTNSQGLGHSIVWNNVAQYKLAKTGVARLFWPEVESNTTFFKGGANDGKTTTFITPGAIIGRIPLSHDTTGKPGRLGLTFGAGEQIAVTSFHTANHALVLTARIPF
ncbi:hypothetical protein [Granulicella sp. S190]|uniref:hypothetical protein n=1 Tax=Granulicella sp. S190 TaxID=1747226 RepID=UPI00131A65B6|nr:hypothetical protein [Granulicella sp. S190]